MSRGELAVVLLLLIVMVAGGAWLLCAYLHGVEACPCG